MVNTLPPLLSAGRPANTVVKVTDVRPACPSFTCTTSGARRVATRTPVPPDGTANLIALSRSSTPQPRKGRANRTATDGTPSFPARRRVHVRRPHVNIGRPFEPRPSSSIPVKPPPVSDRKTTVRTSWPRNDNASSSAPATSPSPPVFANGTASDATIRFRRARPPPRFPARRCCANEGWRPATCDWRLAVCDPAAGGLRVAACGPATRRLAVCDLRLAVCDLRLAACDQRVAACDQRLAAGDLRLGACDLRVAACGWRRPACDWRLSTC